MSRRAASDLRTSRRFHHSEVAVTPRSYDATVKPCTKCGEIKPETEFYAAKGCKDGLRGDCKTCHSQRSKEWYANNRERSIAYVKRWRQENKERVNMSRRERNATRKREIREAHLVRKFGLTQAEYDAMLAVQGGGCAICGDEPAEGQSLHVDHLGDQVRGILCVRCNNALGQLKERVDLAARAADYLASGGFVPGDVYALRDLATSRAQALRAA